ncbi:MAG TPA: hypothetical protein VER12_11375 [Polyangiaceae bacterium]|nr:hypothetical protein [Polyangiaceae bacterium]
MKYQTFLASKALAALGLGALLLAACGGRYQTVRELEENGGSSSGGVPSASVGGSASVRAGSSSAGFGAGSSSAGSGAGSSSAGSSSAGSSSAGASSSGSGGSSGCTNLKCASLKCLGGATPLTLPGQCCPTMCSTCSPCPGLRCPVGTHAETAVGDCCPSCVSDADLNCKKGLQAYSMQRDAILNKYSYGCASDSECELIAPKNLCEQGCSYAAVWYGVADSLESNLSNAADMYCSGCKQGPVPPCVAPAVSVCVNNQCSLVTIK